MSPLGWGRATLLATPWGVAGPVCNILLWVFWIGPSSVAPGYFLCLLVPPCLMAVLSGFIHRSQRVGALAGLLAIGLSVLTFFLVVVFALITSANKIITYSCWRHTGLMDIGNNS
jgi:hypothetical protein